METAPPRKSSAPYGQACLSCVKAKCRCIREGSSCERCTRLKEKCVVSNCVRKKNAKSSTASRKSRLEDKLDDIVSLLRTQTTVPVITSPTSSALLTPLSDHSLKETSIDPPAGILTDQNLLDFHNDHLRYFPSMYLPPNITADQLQQEKPILSLAIHTICTKALSKQRVLSKQVRETLSHKIMVENDRSLDMLLALIVVIIWSTYFTAGKPFLATMTSLARSLTSDLKIDKPHNPSGCPSVEPFLENREPRTNEGSRALLNVFALSTSTSTTFKVEYMSWSTQIEEACDKLSKDHESEEDWVLVTIARICRIVVQAAEIFRRASDDNDFARHIVLHIGPLKMALDGLKSTFTVEQLHHDAIVTYLYCAEISIHELALLQTPSTDPSYSHPLDYKRIDSLSSCLQISKGCIDHFLATEVTKLVGPTMLIFTYCLKIIYKLSTLQDPAWDPTVAKATVDIVHVIQQCAEAADCGNTELKEKTGEDSVLAAAAETMRATAPNWKLPEQIIPMTGPGLMPTWNPGEVADMTLMDFSLDDFWLPSAFKY